MLICDKQVPSDIISVIFQSGLNMSDLGKCREVCSLFKQIIDGQTFEAVWKNGLRMEFEVAYKDYNQLPDEIKINWQGLYIQEFCSQKALKKAEVDFENEKSSENLLKWGELLLKREDLKKNSRDGCKDPWMICVREDRDKAIQYFISRFEIDLRLQITFTRLMCYSQVVDDDDIFNFLKALEEDEDTISEILEDLGLCYLTGRGVEFSLEDGLNYIKRSADYGIASSMFLYAAAMYEEIGSKSESLKYMQMAADQGIKEAQCLLAMHYEDKGNQKLAFEYYRKSALQGERGAQYAAATCYKKGLGTEQNPVLCLSFAKKSAQLDNDRGLAFHLIGQCYEEGFGVPINLELAFENYKLSAEKTCLQGKFKLAKCYFEGIGTMRNLTEALRYGKIAADKGHNDSRLLVSEIYNELNDFSSMFKYAKLAADDGDSSARFIVGAFLLQGIGTERNPQEALKYLIEEEKQNDTE